MTTHPSSGPRLRLAIVGGGIAGINLAISVAPYEDIEINIYEGTAKFEAIGTGIGLWGEGLTIFKRLGILERLMKIAPAVDAPMNLRKANLQHGENFGVLKLSRTMGFLRANFLDELVKVLEETRRATVHFGKRCVSFTQSETDEEVTIHFKDGSSATCDILIGSDGIRSSVRKQLMEEMAEKVGWCPKDATIDSTGLGFTGTVAYRALINPINLQDHPARKEIKTYCGTNKHLVTYPIANGKLVNIIAYSSNPDRHDEWMNGPWTTDVDGSEVVKEFDDFEPEVKSLLAAAEKTSRWALHEVGPLPEWSSGRVALLGDACHAMCPYVGSGGTQVIEDGYVLAQLLGDSAVTPKDIPRVLKAYQYIRKPRVDRVLECTREAKCCYQFMGQHATESLEHVLKSLNNLLEWLREGQYDFDRAIANGKKEFGLLNSREN